MSTEPVTRNMLSRAQSRRAEDALLALSKTDPSFPLYTRAKIAELLTASLSFQVNANNLKLLAEAVEVSLPSNRGNSDSSPNTDLRLTRMEDAMTFILKNFGVPASRGTLDQLKIVTDNWLLHLSSTRTED